MPWVLAGFWLAVLIFPGLASAESIELSVEGIQEPKALGSALKMLMVLTLVGLAPALLLTMTSFVRLIIVFSFLRSALGTQNLPPQQVMVGLSLFLTMAIMGPIGNEVYEKGLGPFLDGKLSAEVAWNRASPRLKDFLLRQTGEEELSLFYDITETLPPQDEEQVAMGLLVPAFVLSELKTAFEMGFLVFAPFLVIDLVVASVLMAMGMVMLPPAMLSLPVKIMLFVVADGWTLLVGSLVRSFA